MLRTLEKLLAFHRYPRYVCGIWRCHSLSQQERAFKEKLASSGANIPASVEFYGMPIITRESGSSIELGERCVICSGSTMTGLGVNHPVVLRTIRSGASIVIGRDTGISGGSICAAIRVKIGNDCLIGANVVIADTDFHPINPAGRRYNKEPQDIGAAPVEIEDNVFIGTGAIILKGVTVGKNSVIGAGAVVTRSVPPDSVVAGNPATILRAL